MHGSREAKSGGGHGLGLRCVTPRQTCPRPSGLGRNCVQRLDGSRDSAIHTKYRISLRSSSMREPKYPLPRVIFNFIFVTTADKNLSTRAPSGGLRATHAARLLPRECFNQFASGPVCEATTMILPQWTSRDVAGSEPPTSPRSEHFTGPFNRPGGTTRPINARSASPAEGTSRPVHTRGGPIDPTQGRIGGVAGEWSSDKANTSRMDNILKGQLIPNGQHITKGRAVTIKWQPITVTTANTREARPSVPIIPQRMSPLD
ncbi:hypothetical protein G2W53_044626 [Senna tora]|uniref:Uncharacterized protein n=1 Tax=Senna tora TaxID=362788 RepID=A0A834SCY1_9FABA|nr:hypothetical protein G2W53_044626 [Senna tora]